MNYVRSELRAFELRAYESHSPVDCSAKQRRLKVDRCSHQQSTWWSDAERGGINKALASVWTRWRVWPGASFCARELFQKAQKKIPKHALTCRATLRGQFRWLRHPAVYQALSHVHEVVEGVLLALVLGPVGHFVPAAAKFTATSNMGNDENQSLVKQSEPS